MWVFLLIPLYITSVNTDTVKSIHHITEPIWISFVILGVVSFIGFSFSAVKIFVDSNFVSFQAGFKQYKLFLLLIFLFMIIQGVLLTIFMFNFNYLHTAYDFHVINGPAFMYKIFSSNYRLLVISSILSVFNLILMKILHYKLIGYLDGLLSETISNANRPEDSKLLSLSSAHMRIGVIISLFIPMIGNTIYLAGLHEVQALVPHKRK